jgi:hypothetical protein
MSVAEAMSPGVNRDRAMMHALSQWAAQAPAEAATRAEEVKDETLRSEALAAVSIAWAIRDPAAAGALAVEEITDPAAQSRAIVSVVQRWAQSDPATAASWVAKFGPGALADTAVGQLVTQWSRSDGDAACRWLGTLPNVATRDAGLASLARTLVQSQPAQAVQCAQLIADPAARQRCLVALGSR